MPIESTLAKITEEVYKSKTAEEAKKVMMEHLQTTYVKDRDKMIDTVSKMDNLIKIQTYFSNCLLKYEGHSLNKYDDLTQSSSEIQEG